MKKRILVVLFALALSANLHAQVTIGELAEPTAGAILDLNKAVKGGLALSVVDLPNFQTIPNGFPDIASQADVTTAVKSGFRGALVYNTGLTSPPAGIYVWNGINWTPVTENCWPLTAASLTLIGPPFAKMGNDVIFSVSSGASAFCSQGESYEWYKTGAGDNDYALIPDETDSSLRTSFSPTIGTYKVKVVVTNRYTATPIEKTATIEITPDDAPPVPLRDTKYAVIGDFCYDVKGPKPSGQTTEYYNIRTDAFKDGAFTKTYTFTYTDGFSDLTVLNPGGIVASVTQPVPPYGSAPGSVSFTITFASDVKDQVITAGAPVQVQLLVRYKNNSDVDKIAYKNIKVQDAVCGCPAKISATQWLTFQCHNLGADYDITSDADLMNINATNFREYHGDWYKLGASTASLENTSSTSDGIINGWGSYPHDSQGWITTINPCPAGWRLPTIAEWSAVNSYNTIKGYVNGVETDSWNINNFNNVLKIGDHLYFPAAGFRLDTNGSLNNRGYGYYWSTTAKYMTFGGPALGTSNSGREETGMSLRCVSAE
jgi:uncharacterized protein (TIGR02145 family)